MSVDGDGRDKPCVYRPSVQRFFCDTACDGGDGDLIMAFGIAADIPLIESVARQFGVLYTSHNPVNVSCAFVNRLGQVAIYYCPVSTLQ